MTSIVIISSIVLGFLIGWCIACIKIKKSAVNLVHKIIKNYIYRCDIDGCEYQFKFDELVDEHLFVNGVDKGWHKIVQLTLDNK